MLGVTPLCLSDIALIFSFSTLPQRHSCFFLTFHSVFPFLFSTILFVFGSMKDTVTGFIMAGIGHRTVDGQNFLIVKQGNINDSSTPSESLLMV